ncbi:MAG: Hsp20 family protein [Alphaproteobacteria bacterium]|nr:Hsp20 family protein [Alphaproteobacteria bacterium]
MRTFDLTPLFRSSVGFDRLNDLLDSAQRGEEQATSYPPYNIEKLGEDEYSITMAVAGFREEDITITAQENLLVVSGNISGDNKDERIYLHKGIGTRAFERKFSLADHVKVTGADLDHGLLVVKLVHEVPEAYKPRNIAINGNVAKKAISSKKAA